MRATRVIASAGESLQIPIDDNDQTVGLSISGDFDGVLQIVGYVSLSGQEHELTLYNFDGTIGDLEEEPPLDLFLDVGGYSVVRVMAVAWMSGRATITAITSSAKRKKLNQSSGPGTGQEVQVTNFPDTQVVTGPLTNTQLRATPVPVSIDGAPVGGLASEVTQASMLALMIGYDSEKNPLPIHFDSTASSYTYNGELVQTEVRVVDGVTYTRTYTYSGENVTGSSAWVKSP